MNFAKFLRTPFYIEPPTSSDGCLCLFHGPKYASVKLLVAFRVQPSQKEDIGKLFNSTILVLSEKVLIDSIEK